MGMRGARCVTQSHGALRSCWLCWPSFRPGTQRCVHVCASAALQQSARTTLQAVAHHCRSVLHCQRTSDDTDLQDTTRIKRPHTAQFRPGWGR